jgi:hypothetical protein
MQSQSQPFTEECMFCGVRAPRRLCRAVKGSRHPHSGFACARRAECDYRQHSRFHVFIPHVGCAFCTWGLIATPTLRPEPLKPLHVCAVQIQCWSCEEFHCEMDIEMLPLFGDDNRPVPVCKDGTDCSVRTHRRHHTPRFAADGLFVNGFNEDCRLCLAGANIVTDDHLAHARYIDRVIASLPED